VSITPVVDGIDLDRALPASPPKTRPAGPTWAQMWLTVALAVAVTVAALLFSDRQQPAPPTPAVQRVVLLDIIGDGQTQYAAVWTSSEMHYPVKVGAAGTYTNATTAIMTVRADPMKTVECRIMVDFATVDIEDAFDGRIATCTWVNR
jgi:hypothetical protein